MDVIRYTTIFNRGQLPKVGTRVLHTQTGEVWKLTDLRLDGSTGYESWTKVTKTGGPTVNWNLYNRQYAFSFWLAADIRSIDHWYRENMDILQPGSITWK